MTRKALRALVALALAVSGSILVAPSASAAPDCRGASGVIRCNSDRISCLLGGAWETVQECL